MGFDFQCIPNIESVPKEYFCAVCRHLIEPKEVLQSMCGHLYCKPCLAYVASTTKACPYDTNLVTKKDAMPLVVSNSTLARNIGNIVVNCLYKKSGCTWVGSLSASTSHCSGCPFGTSLILCTWCGTQTAHRQWQEHAQVCLEMHQRQMHAYIEATAAMTTSQANAQGHGVAAATLTQNQPYAYPLYYGNGYYMHQPLHLPSLAPQHHVNVQPAVHYVAQNHSQMQAQPHLQSQNSVLHQPHTVFPSAPHLGTSSLPQTYPSVPQHMQHPSQTFPAYQGLQNLQPQTHFQTTPLSQPPYSQNAQVPQQKIYPQPNQINQVRAPPNNISLYHNVGTQTSQVPLEYGGAQVLESSYINSSKKPFPKPTLPEQHTVAPTTDVVHNQMHHIGLQNPIGLVQGLQTVQVHQPITPVRGFQPQMNHHFASTSKVGSGQASPSLLAVKEADIHGTQNQVPQASWEQDNVPSNYIFWKQGIEEILDGSEARSTSDSTNAGVNRDVEYTIKFDHEDKGKGIDACVESLHRSSIIEEGNERKTGLLGKQVMEENVGNGQKNIGKSLLVEKKGTGSGPSLNGTYLLDPVLLEQDALRHLNILHQHYLMTANLHSGDVERSRAYSSGSLDIGFDQRSQVSPHRKHELDFELRPASGFSQCSTEGRYRFGLLKSEFEGHDNLQMREKVQDADVIGPVDSNNLWPGDVGIRSLQGFHGDGGSFTGNLGSFPSSRKLAIGTIELEGLYVHSQTREQPTEVNGYGRRDPAPCKET